MADQLIDQYDYWLRRAQECRRALDLAEREITARAKKIRERNAEADWEKNVGPADRGAL